MSYENWLPPVLNERKVRRFAPLCRGDLLDIGCGDRPYEAMLTPRLTSYTGLEHPETQHTARRVDAWGSAMALPFEDERFDTVVSFHVFEHLEDPALATCEAFRVLRPGGWLILGVPFLWGLHEFPRDFFRFTPYGLEHLLARAGFSDRHVEPVCGTWATIGLRSAYFLDRASAPHPKVAASLRPVRAGVELMGAVLDRCYRDYTDAAGYFAVARRPARP